MELDIMTFIQQYATLPVAVICVGVGLLLKYTFEKFPDRWIPITLLVPSVILTLWMNNWVMTFDIMLSAACSAALAVYIHQNWKQLFSAKGATE